MHNSNPLKIGQFYYLPNGTQEPFELRFPAKDFEEVNLTGEVVAKGKLLRVQEGIMLLIASLEATEQTCCARCAKDLEVKIQAHSSEWLFYDEKPEVEDVADECLMLNRHKMEMDVYEAIRQQLLLSVPHASHCAKPCIEFQSSEEAESGLKALAGLKDLVK